MSAAQGYKLDYTETITVLVGPEEKSYTVHTSALTACSAFFRAAVDGGFKESVEKVIRLPDVDLETWSIYVHWIYRNELVPLDANQTRDDNEGTERRDRIIKMYILADRLDDLRLRNRAVDEFREVVKSTKWWKCDNIPLLFNSIPRSSNFWRLILDYVLCNPTSAAEYFGQIFDELPKSFLFSVAEASLKMSVTGAKPTTPSDQNACAYHEHDDVLPSCIGGKSVTQG